VFFLNVLFVYIPLHLILLIVVSQYCPSCGAQFGGFEKDMAQILEKSHQALAEGDTRPAGVNQSMFFYM
jgi:hypothetical protein